MPDGGQQIAAKNSGELVENRTHEAAPARRIFAASPESRSASQPPSKSARALIADSPVSRKYSTRNSSAILPTSCETSTNRVDENADERADEKAGERTPSERSASNSPRCKSRTRLATAAAS